MNPKEYYNKIAKPRHKKEPWHRILISINYRCYNKNSEDYEWYSSRNIKNNLTISDIKYLMERDDYRNLKYPTIDRINNNRDYELSNCEFIENIENCSKDKRKSVLQFNLEGNFIKEWESQAEVSRQLGISQGNIGACCRNERKQAGGFRWEFS